MSEAKKIDEDPIFRSILQCHTQSEEAKRERMLSNRENWDIYHHRQDWAHKQKGQSREFLPKQSQSVEQITSFLQQGLMDVGEWFRIEHAPGVKEDQTKFTPQEVQKLLNRQLSKNDFASFISDYLKIGLLNSLMIAKVGGKWVDSPKYNVELDTSGPVSAGIPATPKRKLIKTVKKSWQLKLSLVRDEDWHPDPTGDGLFNQEIVEMDWYELLELAKKYPKDFDYSVISNLQSNDDYEQKYKKSRETDQNQTYSTGRKRIRFIEHWGNILDPMTGELLHENCVARYTKNGDAITKPMPNPLWHQQHPYVTCPIIRVPFSVWHRALMDAPTQLNRAINEIFNLQFDGAMMSVFGIKQLREDWIENAGEISDGIAPGQTLKANSQCPPGQKVLERIDTGTLEEEAMQMFNVADREYQSASMSSDIRNGTLPQRAVKATEIVASNQAITGTFSGVVKLVETLGITPILEKAWLMSAQHMNDIDSNEVKAIIGEDRANLLSNIPPEDRFASTALGFQYRVFGMTVTLNKIQDFKKIATLLQTIGSSQVLLQEFMRKYSMTNLLGEIVKSLDIDESKLAPSQQELQQREQEKAQMQAVMMAQAQSKGGKRTMEQGANTGSQIPQMSGMPTESGIDPGNPANDQGLTQGGPV